MPETVGQSFPNFNISGFTKTKLITSGEFHSKSFICFVFSAGQACAGVDRCRTWSSGSSRPTAWVRPLGQSGEQDRASPESGVNVI